MNIKKIIVTTVFVFTTLSLTACQSQKEEQYYVKTKDSAYYDMGYNVYENGLIYTISKTAGTQAYFFDYETMNGVPLCNKPNCTHSDLSCISNLCSREFFVPVIYKDYIYWFTSNYKIVDSDDGKSQKPEIKTKCMKAVLDTGAVETFAEIDDVFMNSAIDLIVDKDKLYIIGSREMYQDPVDRTWSSFGRSGEQYLYSINLDSAEVHNYGRINDSPYAENNWIHGASLFSEVKMEGIYNNKLYMYYRYVEDPKIIIDYLNTDWIENGNPQKDIPWIIENKCLDLKTGEITISDLPYAWCIGENHYVYEENDKFFILDENGEKAEAENMYENEWYDFKFVNGKLWKGSINQGFDFKTGKGFSLSEKYSNKDINVLDYINGKYVITYFENEEMKFENVSEEELIGGTK